MTYTYRAPLGILLLLACGPLLAQGSSSEPVATTTELPATQTISEASPAANESVGEPSTSSSNSTGAEAKNAPVDAAESSAAFRGAAVNARLSTLGAGLEAVIGVNQWVNLRVQGNLFNYDDTISEDDIRYEGDLKLQTFGALLDIHPFGGKFRLTGGAYQNGNQIDLEARCVTECEVGDLTISSAGPTDNPRIFGRADFKSLAPYLGFGLGNAMSGSALHFAFDVGVLFQGSPRFDLDADGTATVTDNNSGATTTRNLATDPEVQGELQAEARNAEEDAKQFKYYPVISLTVGYRFDLF